MILFHIFSVYAPQFGFQILFFRKVYFHIRILVKAPLRHFFPLTDLFNRCLCRPFIIIRTYADSVWNIYRMTIVFDFFAIYHCNVSHVI